MADEKITNTGYVDASNTDSKEINEKVHEANVTQVTSHEPYDAVSHNINIGEFAANPAPRADHDQNSLKEELLEEEVLDLYKPFPINDQIPAEDHILTIRAIVTGVILGSLVNASNLYLGMYQSTVSHSAMLTFYRFEDGLHIQLYPVRCHLWLRYHQVVFQMDPRCTNSRGIFWTSGECHHPGRSNRCWRNCWPLRSWSPCDVQAELVER